jgi:hypothetical protein
MARNLRLTGGEILSAGENFFRENLDGLENKLVVS